MQQGERAREKTTENETTENEKMECRRSPQLELSSHLRGRKLLSLLEHLLRTEAQTGTGHPPPICAETPDCGTARYYLEALGVDNGNGNACNFGEKLMELWDIV